MYKQLDGDFFIKKLALKPDYKVEGVIVYGSSEGERQKDILSNQLSKIGIEHQVKKIRFLGDIFEFVINGKNYWLIVSYGHTVLSMSLHIACLLGSQKNIHIGCCGGLKKEINAPEFIIASSSYGNESVTRMYDRGNTQNIYFPNSELSQRIRRKINPEFISHTGSLMNVQALYAETLEDINLWSKEGYVGVEMETATVFALSNHFSVPSASLVYVSDNLIQGQILGDPKHVSEKEIRTKYQLEMYRVAIQESLNL